MPEPTLSQVFGSNSSQTSTQLIISKADLESIGLVPNANNSAESLFISLLLFAKQYLNDNNLLTSPEIQVSIDDPSQSLTTQNGTRYRLTSYTIELYKIEPAATINPMDY